jgi:N-acyl-D-amino-acid deacylase
MNERYDVLIRNASIIDGTGAARYEGDVGVKG